MTPMATWYLEVLRSPAPLPKHIPLPHGRTLVGRAADCDLCIADPRVSSRHGFITLSGNTVEFTDLRSTNGTFLNGKRVQDTAWETGQTLSVGGTDLRLAWKASTDPMRSTPVSLSDSDFDFSIVSSRQIPGGNTSEIREEARHAEALQRRLQILQRAMRVLNGNHSVPEILDRTMQLLFEAVHCDTGYILITDPENPESVSAHVAYADGHPKGNLQDHLYSRTLVSKVLESKTGFLFDSDAVGTGFGGAMPSQSIINLRIKTALCCPIYEDGRVFGVIYLDSKKSRSKFTVEDLDLAMNLAGMAGMVVENAELNRRLSSETRIRDYLRRFLPPGVAEKIIAERGSISLHLHPEKTRVSVLFADIRGFTAMAEGLSPLEVSQLLNIYFSRMSEVVFRHGGTLDKFIGDSMMILFNAPVPVPDHELAAVSAALEMREELAALSREWQQTGLPEIHAGFGLNSGEVVVGSLGTDARLEYTAIGDTVNTAARVCGIAKPDQILITESLHEHTKKRFRATPLGSTPLKGKSHEVILYEVEPLAS